MYIYIYMYALLFTRGGNNRLIEHMWCKHTTLLHVYLHVCMTLGMTTAAE